MSDLKTTDLNNTPGVTEKSVATAPAAPRANRCHSRKIIREWWWLRITSALMVPLSIWFLTALICKLLGGERMDVAAWLGNTPVAATLGLLLVLTFIHTRLGLHEIIIDYVPAPCCRKLANLLVDLGVLALTVASLGAIYHLHTMA